MVLVAYVIVIFLLELGQERLSAYWSSRALLVAIALNLGVPVFSILMISPENIKKALGMPSGVDLFMSKKSKKVKTSEALKKPELYLVFIVFGTIVGIGFMIFEHL